MFNVPEDQWATILAPTQGILPMTEAQYNDFVSYLKRHLALFFRRSNVVHPVPPPSLGGAPGGPGQQHYMMGHGNLWSGINFEYPQPGQPMMGVAWPNAGAGGHGPNPIRTEPHLRDRFGMPRRNLQRLRRTTGLPVLHGFALPGGRRA